MWKALYLILAIGTVSTYAGADTSSIRIVIAGPEYAGDKSDLDLCLTRNVRRDFPRLNLINNPNIITGYLAIEFSFSGGPAVGYTYYEQARAFFPSGIVIAKDGLEKLLSAPLHGYVIGRATSVSKMCEAAYTNVFAALKLLQE